MDSLFGIKQDMNPLVFSLTSYEPVDAGWLSILPPILTMILALLTKEVVISLLIGIVSAATIYVVLTHRGFMDVIKVLFSVMVSRVSSNMYICIFSLLMGSLVILMKNAGGTKAFGDWSQKWIKSRKSAMFMAFIFGGFLFLDDYFNIITTSAIMTVILDRNQVSKPKSAYILHTMASNICILVPITSWAAVIITQIKECGIVEAFSVFMKSIPYNIYPMMNFILVLFTSFSGIEVGGMAMYEDNAQKGLSSTDGSIQNPNVVSENSTQSKGKVIDLVFPILTLIITTVIMIFYLGGGFSVRKPIQELFAAADTAEALMYSSFLTVLITFFLYIPRKLVTFREYIEHSKEGMKTMVDTLLVLVLAWTIGGVGGSLLKTGEFVGDFITRISLPLWLIPSVVFLVGAILTFSLGTTWAGFSVLIPIVVNICKQTDVKLIVPCLSACLCGSVFGDNISPICDNTILVSSCVNCSFLVHVKTETTYAVTSALLSLVGYIVTGLTDGNLLLSIGIPICVELLLFGILFIIRKSGFMKRIARSRKNSRSQLSQLNESVLPENDIKETFDLTQPVVVSGDSTTMKNDG